MSLNWQWSDKMGEVTYSNGRKNNLYQGNAQMIAIAEYEDNTYTLTWFTADRQHLKNQLGLNAKGGYGTHNCFAEPYEITGFRFNTRYKSVKQIVSDLIEAYSRSKTPLQIELYYE